MNYYIIQWSSDEKIMGRLPQVKEVIYNCNVVDDPNFMGQFLLKKVDTEPILGFPVLYPKSNITDLIQAGGMGFSSDLVISRHLKSILEKYVDSGIQFFQTTVFWKGIEYNNFWQMHPYDFKVGAIDFMKAEVYLTEQTLTKIEKLSINSVEEFNAEKKKIEDKGYPLGIQIESFPFREDLEADFFALRHIEGGAKFIVSEKLKREIEESNCISIEFQPTDITFNDWLAPGGEREKAYGRSW